MGRDEVLFQYCLRLGDNALVLAQRLGEWTGKAPVIEEDLATANTALDLIGQARMWLTYAGEVEGKGRGEDELAFLRDASDFRNVLLVEQPNGNFADTIARQFYFDAWNVRALDALSRSRDARIAEIAAKSVKESSYHLERSADWVVRLGDGTAESRAKMQAAIDDLWMYTGELFEPDEVDRVVAESGIGFDPTALRTGWLDEVKQVLDEATLVTPAAAYMQRGGKQGVHTEKLGYLLAEMQFLQRAYPGAQW
ncbi:MAG: phenylacetate-CoA oxygenase subunit PaaC [Burkholderiales bacterium]|jgi:ring-1,2-phenylacetyl-CoA epoxidase subunit PaaC|nr:phenylacetate-CoA oxygenase subunit PaaC [Burkholderiales bacterium]